MTVFDAQIVYKGANSKLFKLPLKTLNIVGGDLGDELLTAVGYVADVITVLQTISDANIVQTTIRLDVSSLIGVSPGPGAGDVFERLSMQMYLDAAGEKTVNKQFPAPALGIFKGTSGENRDILDDSNPDVVSLVSLMSTRFQFSDGELLDTTQNNGIDGGRRITSKV